MRRNNTHNSPSGGGGGEEVDDNAVDRSLPLETQRKLEHLLIQNIANGVAHNLNYSSFSRRSRDPFIKVNTVLLTLTLSLVLVILVLIMRIILNPSPCLFPF